MIIQLTKEEANEEIKRRQEGFEYKYTRIFAHHAKEAVIGCGFECDKDYSAVPRVSKIVALSERETSSWRE